MNKIFNIVHDNIPNSQIISIKKLNIAITNEVYVCCYKIKNNKFKVIIKIFGIDTDKFIDRKKENIIVKVLSDYNIGSTLITHFTYNNKTEQMGRIEKFIDGKTLSCNDINNKSIAKLISKKMAIFHKIEVPINKEPMLISMINRFFKMICCDIYKKQLIINGVNINDITYCINFLNKKIHKSKSPIMLCHNDLQENNIIMTPDNELIFIDMEYGGYNYIFYDIVNHFYEQCFDYDINLNPYFQYNDNFPSIEKQKLFLLEYDKYNNINIQDFCDELLIYKIASNLFWSLWALLNINNTTQFNHLKYFLIRFDLCYNLIKSY